jgi:hypothetical protein
MLGWPYAQSPASAAGAAAAAAAERLTPAGTVLAHNTLRAQVTAPPMLCNCTPQG